MQNKIKTIAHLSDIHIRKLHRLVEYREVFKRLYKKLREIKPDLIYVGGDIVHGKLDTSPEETRLVASFFLKLTSITEVVLITGNHDVNLQNKSREDALSPIIDLVKKINPNIHYWKKSGRYTIRNIDFGVMSIFDIDKNGNQLTDKLPDPVHLDNEHKIALYHGPVDTIEVDSGFKMTTKHVTSRTFNGYDCVLLGDIHKRQQISTYNKDAQTPSAYYCGSLIQQGFAEVPSKGFLLWDVEKRKPQFIQIENDYGFKTITVDNGKILNSTTHNKPKGNIRIKYWNTTLEQIKDIQVELRKQYGNFNNKYKLLKQGSESFLLDQPILDFAFTSPPYFDWEQYDDDESQSYLKWSHLQDWKLGFLFTTLNNAYRGLKQGKYCAINVANTKHYPTFEDDTRECAEKVGFTWVKTYKLQLSSQEQGSKWEPVFLFQKRNNG